MDRPDHSLTALMKNSEVDSLAWSNVLAYIDYLEQEVKHGAELKEAAKELAEYASYAEIVGAIGHNRSAIRKWSDKVFELLKEPTNDQ